MVVLLALFSSVELPRLGVRGGVGSDVGAVEASAVLGKVEVRLCMSRKAGDILEVK